VLPLGRQCELLGVARSTVYYRPVAPPPLIEVLKRRLDELYTAYPFYGSRRMTAVLRREGYAVNRKRVLRLLRELGLQAIYPKANLSEPHPAHQVYPYLLRDVNIVRPNQVWSSDITYVRLAQGFAYLVAVIDWYSRKVLAFGLSNTLDGAFCRECLDAALASGQPELFNTDQGSQFTSLAFTGRLASAGIRISMDGRGRALDNVFVERLWRSVKYEDIYPNGYATMTDASRGLTRYFAFYNDERPHQALKYRTPAEVHAEVVHLNQDTLVY
jgi:putative transposase